MDRFLLAENPMMQSHRVYIFHTQLPAMLIEIHHESFAIGDGKMYFTGNYENNDGEIETITLNVTALLVCDPELTEGMKNQVEKTLNDAWTWYVNYLSWEDQQILKK